MIGQAIAVVFVSALFVVLFGISVEAYLQARDKERGRREAHNAR